MLKKTKNKNLKPIEVDGHFKYVCPNCGINHWASFKEASTKRFVIVCDCEQILSLKRLSRIDIVYVKKKKIQKKEEPVLIKEKAETVVKEVVKSVRIPDQTLDKATKMLVALGFTKDEAENMLREAYSVNPTENIALLVKNSVAKIGGFNG